MNSVIKPGDSVTFIVDSAIGSLTLRGRVLGIAPGLVMVRGSSGCVTVTVPADRVWLEETDQRPFTAGVAPA